MTFPVIEASSTFADASSASSYSVTLPSSIASGDLLVLFIKVADGIVGINTPTDWSLLLAANSGTFNSDRLYVFTKEATGSEGSTVSITLGTARRIAAVCYRISGVDHARVEAQLETTLVNDPPSITASWGSADNLFIAAMGNLRTDNAVTSPPTNYGSEISIGQASNTNDTRCRMSTAHRNYAAATDDPDAFTMSGTILNPVSVTVVIGPASGATITGSGTPAAQAATVAGTATRTVTGSGTPTAQAATASGTAERSITGSGTPTAQAATVAGSGQVGIEITGSGTPQAQSATVTGTAERSVTGTGTPQAQASTVAGAAVRTITGSGTPTAQAAIVDGAGQVGSVVTGSGTPTAQNATVSGTALRVITGTGAPTAQAATATGTGTRVITGTGTCAANDATVDGAGLQIVTGTGSAVSGPATTTGVALRIVTGSGTLQSGRATVTGYDLYKPSRFIAVVGYENRTARVASRGQR